MGNIPDTVQKIQLFLKAFLEFLRRPKTVFDIKDRAKLLLLLFLAVALLELLIGCLEER